MLVYYKADPIIISLQINLYSFDSFGVRTHDVPHSREHTDHYTIDEDQNIFL
jgi:hypothetical protein